MTERQLIDYIILSEFDKLKGMLIKKQLPSNLPLISNQLDFLIDLLMPLNLHKYLNKEHYTIIPLYIDNLSGLISYDKDAPNYERCYLFTICYFQDDDSYRNGTAKSISIIIRSPIFEIFKPLLTYILHDLFKNPVNYSLDDILHSLNNLNLFPLIEQFNFNHPTRFLLARLENSKVPLDLDPDQFSISNNVIKTFINVGEQRQIKFPIQIPLESLISSSLCNFGLDLKKEGNFRKLLLSFNEMEIIQWGTPSNDLRKSSIIPYLQIKPIMIIINALIMKKKIILYCYDTCYNELMDMIKNLILLIGNDNTDYPWFPILDLGNLQLVSNLDHYLIGTSNLLFREKLNWDVYVDLDSFELFVKSDSKQANLLSTTSAKSVTSDDLTNDESSSNDYLEQDDKRSSIVSTAESKLKSLFKRSSSISQNIPATYQHALDQTSVSYISDANNLHNHNGSNDSEYETNRLYKLKSWDTKNFPRFDNSKRLLGIWFDNNTKRESNFFQLGFNFKANQIIRLLNNKTEIPQIDIQLTSEINRLLSEHHDDSSILISLSDHIITLKTIVLKTFKNFENNLRLTNYKNFVSLKVEEDEYTGSGLTVNNELKNYIKVQRTILPIVVGFPYSTEENDSFVFEDQRLYDYYYSVLVNNGAYYKMSKRYNELENDLETGLLYGYNDLCLSVDFSYLTYIIDRLIDSGSNQTPTGLKMDWRLNKIELWQLYKIVNQLLKISNGVADKRSKINGKKATNVMGSGKGPFETLLCFIYLSTNLYNCTLDTTKSNKIPSDNTATVNHLKGFEKLLVVSSIYYSYNTLVDCATSNDQTLSSSTPTANSSFESSTTSSSKKNNGTQDEILIEFKKFLSLVLNNDFFKKILMVSLSDFVKLNINDFIDYHM